MRGSLDLTALVVLAGVLALAAPAEDAAAPNAEPAAMEPGQTRLNVACRAAPELHYDLYVPKGYKAGSPTPVLLVFSPRGRVPMELYRVAADQVGWIVCGSVESQNGLPWPRYDEIFTALLTEMRSRATVHPHRVYLSGMSGGSRVAMEMLRLHGEVAAGAVCMAAARSGPQWPQGGGAACVGLVGTHDYNYFEFVGANETLPDRGIAYKLLDWDGPHDWAPPQLIGRALLWLDAQYFIRSPHLTDAEAAARPKRVADCLKRAAALGDTLEAYETWEALARDLKSDAAPLREATEALEKLRPRLAAELAARAAVGEAWKPFAAMPLDEKSLTDLQSRMRPAAAEHAGTVYGRRAAALAATLDETLKVYVRSRKEEPKK